MVAKKERTDGVRRLFGLRGHWFTRAAADGTATGNDWERVGEQERKEGTTNSRRGGFPR